MPHPVGAAAAAAHAEGEDEWFDNDQQGPGPIASHSSTPPSKPHHNHGVSTSTVSSYSYDDYYSSSPPPSTVATATASAAAAAPPSSSFRKLSGSLPAAELASISSAIPASSSSRTTTAPSSVTTTTPRPRISDPPQFDAHLASPVRRKPIGTAATPGIVLPPPPPPPSWTTSQVQERPDTAIADQGTTNGFAIRRKSPRRPSSPTAATAGVAATTPPTAQTSPPRHFDGLAPPPPPPPPAIFSPDIPLSSSRAPFHELPPDQARAALANIDGIVRVSPPRRPHGRSNSTPRSPVTTVRPRHQIQRSETMGVRAPGPEPIQIVPPSDYTGGNGLPTPNSNGMSKFGALFGWKGKSPHSPLNESTPTTISDRSSPAQSPNGTSLTSFPPSGKMLPSAIDISHANMPSAALFSGQSFVQPLPTPTIQFQMEEMEDELRDITTELAFSIRRELELEEQVERLQLEGPNALEKDKRTSDYFSDSGASSNRDADNPPIIADDLERQTRRSGQEKAEMKLDLSRKLQEERGRRRRLEEHIRSLEEHVQNIEMGRSSTGHVVELERRLSQEKKHKENVQDMVKALREDLENHKNERDNLRDEVVPALRARVEGLETEASGYQQLQYENARMQQELHAFKSGRVATIAEGEGTLGRPRGMSRSGSVLRGGGGSGVARSNSTKTSESREALIERVKDTEAQRDALHQALKNLLDRQRLQTKTHEKQIRAIELERDAALDNQSPRRRGFEQEVGEMREEIDLLRRRADDALAQKWQCEKGLGGLKKDLDRAEQETDSLRELLRINGASNATEGAGSLVTIQATSQTLENAYRELAAARTQAESLQDAASVSAEERTALSQQLFAAGQRVEILSSQVQRQIAQNSELQQRLTLAITKGEDQQTQSTQRISDLQSRLRSLEEQLSSAQQHSEDSVQAHEEDVRDMRQNEDRRLLRLKTSLSNLQSPRHSNLPLSPFSPVHGTRTPRLDRTSTGPGMNLAEVHRTEHLESRVRDLERALRDADAEMSEVVQRMNLAQMEALELQTARDEAHKMTRALQSQLEAESAGMGSLVARSLRR